jgi:hypothetical protein
LASALLSAEAMAHVTALAPHDGYTAPIDRSRRNYRHIRVLRWTFRREDEAVVCELGLTGEDREYELRYPGGVEPDAPRDRTLRRCPDSVQRHAMIERTLLDAGWVLDGFESERVTLH